MVYFVVGKNFEKGNIVSFVFCYILGFFNVEINKYSRQLYNFVFYLVCIFKVVSFQDCYFSVRKVSEDCWYGKWKSQSCVLVILLVFLDEIKVILFIG